MKNKTVQFPTPSNDVEWDEQDIQEFMDQFDPNEETLTEFLQQ